MELLVLPYPVIDPIAIEVGPVAIRWYGLAYMAGLLLGWLYARRLVSRPDLWGGKPPMPVAQADDFLLWITLGIVVGGRVGFGLFFGPLANFLNSEVVGRVSDVPWAMVFPGAGDAPRHPSQLYEAFLEGIVLFVILRIATHRFHALTRPGTAFGLFLVFYGLVP